MDEPQHNRPKPVADLTPPEASQSTVQEAPTGPRAFTISALGWITFWGGPLAGALGLAYNARRFGHMREAAYIVVGGIVAMALFLVLTFQFAESTSESFLFRGATALFGLLAVTAIAERTQKKELLTHKAAGGRDGSGWLGVGIVLASWGLLAVISLVVALSTPVFEGTSYERVGGGTVYASGGATEADARYVGTALRQFGYFPDGEVAQVSRGQDSVRVSMLLIPEIETDTLFLQEVHLLAAHLQQALRAPVAIVNVVDGFSGRRQTVLTDVLPPELRFRPPPPPLPEQSGPPLDAPASGQSLAPEA